MSLPDVVAASQLTKVYDDGDRRLVALDGVTFTVGAGEFVAVVGSSGSGKSTLLHLLGGLDTATSGSVRVGGVDLATLTGRARADYRRTAVGFVFQAYHLVPGLTVAENVALPAVVSGLRRSQWLPRAMELLDGLGLADRADSYPTRLSGGQRQRVAVARAVYNRPRLVLADEPTGNLDTATGASVMTLLRSAVDGSDAAVVVVTHDPEVAGTADRLVALRDGTVIDSLLLRQGSDVDSREGGADAQRVRTWLATTTR